MAATVSIYFDTGGTDANPASEDDIDILGPPNLRFKVADNITIDTNDPIPIPGAGIGYSYWKQIYLYCDAPDGNSINNLRLYADGANNFGTGVDLFVGLQFPIKTNALNTGYEVADTTDEMVAGTENHSGITSSASIFDYDVGSPLTVSINEDGNVIDAIGETSNYIVLQMNVASTASPGELPVDETLTIKYDEQ